MESSAKALASAGIDKITPEGYFESMMFAAKDFSLHLTERSKELVRYRAKVNGITGEVVFKVVDGIPQLESVDYISPFGSFVYSGLASLVVLIGGMAYVLFNISNYLLASVLLLPIAIVSALTIWGFRAVIGGRRYQSKKTPG